jgi:hypothetical protein
MAAAAKKKITSLSVAWRGENVVIIGGKLAINQRRNETENAIWRLKRQIGENLKIGVAYGRKRRMAKIF